MVIVPPACAMLTPDTAAETSAVLLASMYASMVAGPFVCAWVDRCGDYLATFKLLASCSLASSLLFTIAFNVSSVAALCTATFLAAVGSQTAVQVASAFATTLLTAAPDRAGTIYAMNMVALSTAPRLTIIVATFFPLSRHAARWRNRSRPAARTLSPPRAERRLPPGWASWESRFESRFESRVNLG